MQPQIPCTQCAASIDRRRRDGLCDPCSRKPCLNCGIPTGPKNKSGRCAPCSNAHVNTDPAIRINRRDAIRNKHATDPLFAARMREMARRMGLKAGRDPELRERRVIWGKWVYANVLSRPDIAEKTRLAVKEKAGKTQHERKLAWCPPEYRAEYMRLLRSAKLSKAEAVPIILAQVKADLAKLSPFERQERALAKGAALVANDSTPMFGEAIDYGEARWTA